MEQYQVCHPVSSIRSLPVLNPLAIPCPKCNAQEGEPCDGGGIHIPRRGAAIEMTARPLRPKVAAVPQPSPRDLWAGTNLRRLKPPPGRALLARSLDELFTALRRTEWESLEDYWASDSWRETRLAKLADGRACFVCGATSRPRVHHLRYSRLGREPPSDLVVLCPTDHDLTHALHIEGNIPLDVAHLAAREYVAARAFTPATGPAQ